MSHEWIIKHSAHTGFEMWECQNCQSQTSAFIAKDDTSESRTPNGQTSIRILHDGEWIDASCDEMITMRVLES